MDFATLLKFYKKGLSFFCFIGVFSWVEFSTSAHVSEDDVKKEFYKYTGEEYDVWMDKELYMYSDYDGSTYYEFFSAKDDQKLSRKIFNKMISESLFNKYKTKKKDSRFIDMDFLQSYGIFRI